MNKTIYEVLLIEGDPADALVIEEAIRALQPMRVHVTIAENSAVALLLLQEEKIRPDLIIANWNDGKELLASYRPHEPPIVAFSVYPPETIRAAVPEGVPVYGKPTDLKAFLDTTRRLVMAHIANA